MTDVVFGLEHGPDDGRPSFGDAPELTGTAKLKAEMAEGIAAHRRGVFDKPTPPEPEKAPEIVEAEAGAARLAELAHARDLKDEYLLDTMRSGDPNLIADVLLVSDPSGLQIEEFYETWRESNPVAAEAWALSRLPAAALIETAYTEHAEKQAKTEREAHYDRITEEFQRQAGITEGTRNYELVREAVVLDPADDSTPALWKAKLHRASNRVGEVLKAQQRANEAREMKDAFRQPTGSDLLRGRAPKEAMPEVTADDISARIKSPELRKAAIAERNAEIQGSMGELIARKNRGVFGANE